MGIHFFEELFVKNEKASDDQSFSPVGTLANCWEKEISKKALLETKKLYSVIKFFDFCKNNYILAINTHFWAWSNFNSFANFGSLMTNDGALESSHQGDFDFCHLAGGRNKFKKKYLLRANRQ